MKTQIKKIIITAVALLFFVSGVSFADGGDARRHKSHRKASGHYNAKKYHRNYEKRHRHWNNRHYKPVRHYRNKYVYQKAHRHKEKYHYRRSPRAGVSYKIAVIEPGFVFKIIVR